MELTLIENKRLQDIIRNINTLKIFLNENILNETDNDIKKWYKYLKDIKNIIGNFDGSISFISCLMAKDYLEKKYSIESFDVAIKSQYAPGLDINIITVDRKHIIAEIKATKSISINNLGSKQKESIFRDIKKLKNKEADFKYYFLTEKITYDIMKKKYNYKFSDIELVLLQ